MNAYLLLDPRFIHLRSYMGPLDTRDRYQGWLAAAVKRLMARTLRMCSDAAKRRQAREVLRALDNRLLNDIGIDRCQIDLFLDGLLSRPTASAKAATVHPLERPTAITSAPVGELRRAA